MRTPDPVRTAAPAGWYADPWQASPWRWWDGGQWTPYVWPAWPAGHTAAVTPQHGRGMRRAFWPTVGWMLVSMAAGLGVAIPPAVAVGVLAGEDAAVTATVIAFYPVMFLGFWLAARKIATKYGQGDLRVDFGWRRFRAADIGWGLLAGLAALVAQVIVGALLPQPDDDRYREAVLGTNPGVVMLVAMGLAIVIGAPLFEELLFRGPMMRSLIARFGTVPGLLLQGGVFSVYHVIGDPRLAGLWYLLPLFVVGVIFGMAAQHTGRLATSQIAHAFMNALAFAAMLLTL